MKYEPAYDGLRAISIISVVAYHISGRKLPGGWAGVDVFFVLSGFLITSILSRELRDSGVVNLKLFYMKRFLRLGPALIGVVAFTLLVGAFSDKENFSANYLTPATVSIAYFMNWSRAFDIFPQGMLGHTWSLSMEEQFYVVWPILFLFIFRRNPILWLTVIIAVSTIWRVYLVLEGANAERTYNGFDTHADGLMIGCLVALLSSAHREALEKIAAKFALLPILSLTLTFLFLRHESSFTQSLGLGLSALLSAWVILATKDCHWLRASLSQKALVYTGRISYGWYLWHYPILLLTKRFFAPHGFLNVLVVDAFVFCASYLVAMASFRYLEIPFLKLKDNLGENKSDLFAANSGRG